MQEEIEHKTVNLAISTTKLSARTLLRGMQFLLRQYDKHASQGKQSMKRLVRQNRGVTNVEIQKTGIKDFDRYAKRYHIDYAIQKDLSCTPPRYLIYFKAQDTDALSAAFKEYFATGVDKTNPLPCGRRSPTGRAPLHPPRQNRGRKRGGGREQKKKTSLLVFYLPFLCWVWVGPPRAGGGGGGGGGGGEGSWKYC